MRVSQQLDVSGDQDFVVRIAGSDGDGTGERCYTARSSLTNMAAPKQVVLVASRDPQQAVIRKNLLEQAGFQVLSDLDRSQVEEACSRKTLAGVVIGWSVPVDEKRRVWTTVREVCGPDIPIVELLRGGKTELLPDRALFPYEWDDKLFAETVAKILKPN